MTKDFDGLRKEFLACKGYKKLKERMEEGLDCYDPENRVFPVIERNVKKGQELSYLDVLLIFKWKLGRVTEQNFEMIRDGGLKEINGAVKIAGGSDRGEKIKALKTLMKIKGIKLAMGTAILTVCYPDEFTIIDWRVLEVLGLMPVDSPGWNVERYFDEYLPMVKEYSDIWDCTLRDADRALWGLSVRNNMKKKIYPVLENMELSD
jgi:hypothetical protein